MPAKRTRSPKTPEQTTERIKPPDKWLNQAASLKKRRPPTPIEQAYWDSAARALGVPDDWIYDDEAGEFRPKTP